jgi:hypothetical protein
MYSSACEKLQTRLESRPHLYSVTVGSNGRPLIRPSQRPKGLGRPRIGTSVAKDNEANQDPMDVDIGRENKRQRQSTLSFLAVEMETDPTLEQLGS